MCGGARCPPARSLPMFSFPRRRGGEAGPATHARGRLGLAWDGRYENRAARRQTTPRSPVLAGINTSAAATSNTAAGPAAAAAAVLRGLPTDRMLLFILWEP